MLDLKTIDEQTFTGFDNEGNPLEFKAEVENNSITLYEEDVEGIEIDIEINKDNYWVMMSDSDTDEIVVEFDVEGELLKSDIPNVISRCIKQFLKK